MFNFRFSFFLSANASRKCRYCFASVDRLSKSDSIKKGRSAGEADEMRKVAFCLFERVFYLRQLKAHLA